MNVAIEIPDDIGRVLGGQAGDVSRAVLEAVAVEAYRSGTITPAQVQQMLGLRSRWETESFLRRAEAYHDYTMNTWNGTSPQFATHPGNDRRLGYVPDLLSGPHRRDRHSSQTLQLGARACGRDRRTGPRTCSGGCA